jgi:uncharacterized protein
VELAGFDFAFLCLLVFLAAGLYSSVGHAGASGYLAAMALYGLPPTVMKPTALTLNILVASFATIRLQRAGLVNWRMLLLFSGTSVPLAFLGGSIQLPGHWYRALVGLVLLFAALRLFVTPKVGNEGMEKVPPLAGALVIGGTIGLLSGLTGTGGGIFLSPVLLLLGWAAPRQASGITAPFILVNSIAGLVGNLKSVQVLPQDLIYLAPWALLGAVLGTQLGIKWLAPATLQRALGLVLVIAVIKFIST